MGSKEALEKETITSVVVVEFWKTVEVGAVEGAVMETSDEELMMALMIGVDFWETGEEGVVEGANSNSTCVTL